MRTLPVLFAALSAGVMLTPLAPAPAAAQKKERDLITREELLEIAPKATDLLQAIRKLRSHFLQPQRGPRTTNLQPGASGTSCDRTSGGPDCSLRGGQVVAGALPVVYVDDAKMGELEHLKNYPTENVAEVRYLSGNKAGMEYGLGHEGGAILVKLFKGVRP